MKQIEHNGRTYTVEVFDDENMGAPWKEFDVHGIVSEWERRDKRPGELVLCEDRRSRRFYDVAATMKLAKKEGWGLSEQEVGKLAKKLGRNPTKGEIVAESVRRDYEYLRGWCNGDWNYVWVKVTDDETGEWDSLGGIESSDADYIQEVAMQLILDRVRADKDELKKRQIEFRFSDAMECGI